MREIKQIKIFRCRSIIELEKEINIWLFDFDPINIDNIIIKRDSILGAFILYREVIEDNHIGEKQIESSMTTYGNIDYNDEWFKNLSSNDSYTKNDEFNDEFSNMYLQGKEDTPLYDMQKKFVIEYVESGDAKKAAIKAGYHEKFNGNTLLIYKKFVKAIRSERMKKDEQNVYTDY